VSWGRVEVRSEAVDVNVVAHESQWESAKEEQQVRGGGDGE